MGADTSPGIGASTKLNAYWVTGEGKAKWANSPTPYRTLLALLLKYYHMVFGTWPGTHH